MGRDKCLLGDRDNQPTSRPSLKLTAKCQVGGIKIGNLYETGELIGEEINSVAPSISPTKALRMEMEHAIRFSWDYNCMPGIPETFAV